MQEQSGDVELSEYPEQEHQATASSLSSSQLHGDVNRTAPSDRQLKASTRKQFDALLQKSLALQVG